MAGPTFHLHLLVLNLLLSTAHWRDIPEPQGLSLQANSTLSLWGIWKETSASSEVCTFHQSPFVTRLIRAENSNKFVTTVSK